MLGGHRRRGRIKETDTFVGFVLDAAIAHIKETILTIEPAVPREEATPTQTLRQTRRQSKGHVAWSFMKLLQADGPINGFPTRLQPRIASLSDIGYGDSLALRH